MGAEKSEAFGSRGLKPARCVRWGRRIEMGRAFGEEAVGSLKSGAWALESSGGDPVLPCRRILAAACVFVLVRLALC